MASLGSSFSSSSLFFSPCRSGIAFISSSQSFMLCFGFTLPSRCYAVKEVNSSCTFMIRAFIASF
jgi:hypothetical protein